MIDNQNGEKELMRKEEAYYSGGQFLFLNSN